MSSLETHLTDTQFHLNEDTRDSFKWTTGPMISVWLSILVAIIVELVTG